MHKYIHKYIHTHTNTHTHTHTHTLQPINMVQEQQNKLRDAATHAKEKWREKWREKWGRSFPSPSPSSSSSLLRMPWDPKPKEKAWFEGVLLLPHPPFPHTPCPVVALLYVWGLNFTLLFSILLEWRVDVKWWGFQNIVSFIGLFCKRDL